MRSQVHASKFLKASYRSQLFCRPASKRPLLLCRASGVAVSAGPKLTLHIDQTSLSFPFRVEAAKELDTSLQQLLQTFAAKQKAERPQRWKSMEFRLKGDTANEEVEFLEIFCNPNAASTAFDAKALITLKTSQGVQVITEGRLSSLKADVDAYLGQLV